MDSLKENGYNSLKSRESIILIRCQVETWHALSLNKKSFYWVSIILISIMTPIIFNPFYFLWALLQLLINKIKKLQYVSCNCN